MEISQLIKKDTGYQEIEPDFLPWENFQAKEQGKETQAEPDRFPGLRRQS